MNRRFFDEKVLYRVANRAIFACIGLFMPFFGIHVVTWPNVLVLLLVLALFAGISLLPAKGKGLLVLVAVICLGVSVAVIGPRVCLDFLQAYFHWCMGDMDERAEWLSGFRLLQTAMITVVSLLVQTVLEKIKYLKYVLAFACADGMLFCLFAQISLTHMGVVFMLFYVAVVYVEWLQEHWKKKQSGSLQAQMIWLLPFLSAYLLFMALMPVPEKPYDWQWAKDIFAQVKESFLVVSQNIFRSGHEDFDLALSDFSDDGELGGGVGENDRERMRIQVQSNGVTSIYLAGKIYDTFDGTQWLQEYHDDKMERFIDTLETVYAVRRLDNNHQRDYIREINLKIRYQFFNTEYVFAPLKTRNISGRAAALEYFFEGSDMLWKELKGYGTEYDVSYYQLNIGEELFGQLLEAYMEPNEALWEVIAREYETEIGQRVTLDMLEAHRQTIYENYLDEVVLSKEVESYLSEITREAATDLEKLQAIEREFNSYTYTKTPGQLPDKVTNAGEFLDYFLLESRQGYCTYFATAFVLLARAEGIPARYVHGFCVPVNGNREVTVLSNMAHSWPEVYIDDVGWIPFEPTPGYGSLRYAPWGVSAHDRISESEEEKVLDEVMGGVMDEVMDGVLANLEGETVDVPENPNSGDESGIKLLWRVLAFCILAILAVFTLALVLDNLLGAYRYSRMSVEGRLKIELRRNMRMLSWLGLKREEQETLQELRERGMLVLEPASLRFIEDYEDVVYGGKVVGEEMLQRIREERAQLWRFVRAEKKWKYYFYKAGMLLVRYR